MNAAEAKRTGKEVTRGGRLWKRGWFHLSALGILIPIVYFKPYIDLQAMFLGDAEPDLRQTAFTAGPWTFQLQERGEEEPFWDPEEGYVKAFRLVPCATCAKEVRAVYVSLRRPGSTEYGVQFEGNPYRSFGNMKMSRGATGDDKIWLTIEGWDGRFFQTTLRLEQASPITARWLDAGTPDATP